MAGSIVALLGTLRELHATLPGYDWRRLEALVAAKRPDLLCVEIGRGAWEAGELMQAPSESREALARLAQASDITLVPIGAGGGDWAASGVALPRRGLLATVRRSLSRLFDRMTVGLMRLAGGPKAINSPLVEHLCAMLCDLQLLLAEPEARRAWTAKNEELYQGVVWAALQDPGRRLLVALDCRRKHWLRRRLRKAPEVTVVDFWRF